MTVHVAITQVPVDNRQLTHLYHRSLHYRLYPTDDCGRLPAVFLWVGYCLPVGFGQLEKKHQYHHIVVNHNQDRIILHKYIPVCKVLSTILFVNPTAKAVLTPDIARNSSNFSEDNYSSSNNNVFK